MRDRVEMHGVVSSRKIAVSRCIDISETGGIRGGWRVAAVHKPEGAARRSSQVENAEKRHGYAVGPVPQLHERAPELATGPADFYSAARGCQPPPGTRIRL